MAFVEPIINKEHVKKATGFIKDNFDSAYHLIWSIGIETGYRITDITEIKYSDIDYDKSTIKIAENKGSKANKARARLKVLEQVKNELIAMYCTDNQKMMNVFVTKAKDIYELVPVELKTVIDSRIDKAMSTAKLKYRSAKLSDKTICLLKARELKYKTVCGNNVFDRATLSSNRARNCTGVISRQSCYRVFSKLTGFMATLGEKVKVACHSLRKIFARHLYTSSGNNIGLLMRTIGHSSAEMSLRYIGINDNEQLEAIDHMFTYMDFN